MADRYHIAAFAMDGSLEGVGVWQRSKLAPRWLDVAATLIAAAIEHGRANVPIEHLEHLQLRVTRVSGVTLATYYAREKLVLSTLLLPGDAPSVEPAAAQMFVESLRASIRRMGLAETGAFSALFGLNQRPLHVVVPWVNDEVSDEDQDLIRELSTHVAGSVLTTA